MLRLMFVLTPVVAGVGMASAAAAFMPLPVKVEARSGKLAIDGNFNIAASGCPDARVSAAAGRLVERISRQTGIPMTGGRDVRLTVECRARGSEYPTLGEDESYTLDVASDGASVKAATGAGALRGMETFAQAIVPGAVGFEAAATH